MSETAAEALDAAVDPLLVGGAGRDGNVLRAQHLLEGVGCEHGVAVGSNAHVRQDGLNWHERRARKR